MGIINDKIVHEILEHIPEEKQQIFVNQVKIMEQIILDNQDLYKTDLGFRTAIDTVIRTVLSGEFIKEQE
jgi:hypothetical protein